MPVVDINTVLIVLIAGHGAAIILLLFELSQYESEKYDYVFVLGRFFQLAGWGLIVGRDIWPYWLSFAVGNSAAFLGWALEGLALISLRYVVSRRCIKIYLGVYMLSVLLIWSLLGIKPELTILLLSFLLASMLSIPGGVFLLPGHNSSRLQKFIGSVYLLSCGSLVWRGFNVWYNGQYTLFSNSAAHMAALLSMQALLIVGAMGYVMIKKERLSTELRVFADTDHLTKLYNRRAFIMLAEKYLRLAARKHYSMAVMMIDIDLFKSINDRYGHAVGDEVIANLATILKTHLRDSDIACRYGGEEFVVLLPECGREEAFRSAERLRQAVEQANPHSIAYTISIGVSTAYGKQSSLETLITRADTAMYKAKELGRNCVQVL